jgi:hypothetical protein
MSSQEVSDPGATKDQVFRKDCLTYAWFVGLRGFELGTFGPQTGSVGLRAAGGVGCHVDENVNRALL